MASATRDSQPRLPRPSPIIKSSSLTTAVAADRFDERRLLFSMVTLHETLHAEEY